MAHSGQHVDLDEKPIDIEHKEVAANADLDYGLKKSRFDDLSIPRTLWVFRKTVLVVLSVYTGQSALPCFPQLTDLQDTSAKVLKWVIQLILSHFPVLMLQLGAGGSIIANQGFIKEFGNGGADGNVRDLDPTWGKPASTYIKC
jgi:SP family general alpha glucoside:H+ symporter-like MFS transporter